MAGYKIQLKDKNGNRQYPVSTVDVVVDADGVSVADLLDRKQPTLVSGVNIKTINGKTLLGEGDLVIEGGTADLSGYATTEYVDAKVGESYPVYVPLLIGEETLTDEQKEENKATYEVIRDTWDYFFPHIYLAPNKGISFIPFDNHYDEPVGYVDLLLSVKSLIASVRDLASGSTLEGWEDEKFLADATISIRLYADGNVEVTQEEYFATPSTNVLRAILTYITLGMGGGGASLIPDSEMSDTSTNAVQNKVIKAYVDSKIGGGSGETAESDVICVVWDDDTSDIPSNKEAYQKLAESINTVGKPAAVMVCVETGYRWGIAKYYWKSNVGGDIELTTPVTESGLYCVFTLTSEGVCTASYKQVDLGGGGDSSNVVSFYMPLMDDSIEVVTYEDCINEITTRFADTISQEVIDAITSHFQSMIDHNVASFAELEERLRNGEKPMIVMRGFTYWLFLLMIYLWAVAEGGGMDMTDEELIAELDLFANIYEVIYPESYMMDFDEGSGAYLEVNVEDIGVSIGANGNWEKQSETDVRKSATLYYEGAARLTAKECEVNLKSKGNRLNNCDFQVNRYRGDGWSDNEDVLIIGKTTKTVSDFVNLNGDVVTCGVTAFRYIEDTKLIELQVSNEDGYCRRVELGDVVASGSSEDGGLKYFVERYVYEGKTEEERTYNLESLAMLYEGADILWAGMGGLQPNYEYGSMWGYMATLAGHNGVFAKVDIDSETGALVMQTVEFIRDFYFAQGSEMKVLAANFFKIEGWMWESAFYLGRPILYWHDGETDTMVNAYFLLDGLRTAYVSINIETGEVGSPVPVQSN